jgi:hypothetical protein
MAWAAVRESGTNARMAFLECGSHTAALATNEPKRKLGAIPPGLRTPDQIKSMPGPVGVGTRYRERVQVLPFVQSGIRTEVVGTRALLLDALHLTWYTLDHDQRPCPASRLLSHRICFTVRTGEMMPLHGFIKKTQKTPLPDRS